jgi:hypothetical protein
MELDSFVIAKLPVTTMKINVKHRHGGKNQQSRSSPRD